MVRQTVTKLGMMKHFDPLKPNDGQFKKNQDGGRPMPEQVRGRYTQSDSSAENRTGMVWMPMGCTLAQPGKYD